MRPLLLSILLVGSACPHPTPPVANPNPQPDAAVEPKVTPTSPPASQAATSPASSQEGKATLPPLPELVLPVRMVVRITNDDGKRHKELAVLCRAIEAVVAKSTSKNANLMLMAFSDHLFSRHQGGKGRKMTLYPKLIGYLLAESLVRNKPALTGRLISMLESGEMAKLAESRWKP